MSALLPALIRPGQPITALAPMQDVTDLPFMQVVGHYGAPDYFFTEFLRVHATSRPEADIVRTIHEHNTGRPIFAQMIGEDIPHLLRTAKLLEAMPIAGIDLNLGCPAPKVYKKNVGGGLLRDPAKVDEIIAALRAATPGLFTVKMRIGFEDTANYEALLASVARHRVDLLSVHGRTVKEMYRSEVHFDAIARAVQAVPCPVLANGNVTSAPRAVAILQETGAAGVMIGRHAIRNPWIFRQCREIWAGEPVTSVTLADVRDYIERLFAALYLPEIPAFAQVGRMKKFLNFVGQSVDPDGAFLHDMRRTRLPEELFAVCDRHLLNEPTKPFSPEPYAGVIARPNCETPTGSGEPAPCSLDTISA